MSARGIPRRAGKLASDFTQCQYLTTKDSIPCHIIPVIPSLVKYVQLIAMLKIESFNFSKIQDLGVFDLDKQHTLITRISISLGHILRHPALPYTNKKHDLAVFSHMRSRV